MASPLIESMELKPKWRERFEFFEAHGAPDSDGFKAAIKARPFLKRITIVFSFLGFFVGPFYFLYLGMWRKALTLFACAIVLFLIELLIYSMTGRDISQILGFVLSGLSACTVNYSYYLKRIKGSDGWNILEGIQVV